MKVMSRALQRCCCPKRQREVPSNGLERVDISDSAVELDQLSFYSVASEWDPTTWNPDRSNPVVLADQPDAGDEEVSEVSEGRENYTDDRGPARKKPVTPRAKVLQKKASGSPRKKKSPEQQVGQQLGKRKKEENNEAVKIPPPPVIPAPARPVPVDPFERWLPMRVESVVSARYANPEQKSPLLAPLQEAVFMREPPAEVARTLKQTSETSPVVFLISRSKNLNTVVYRVKENVQWGIDPQPLEAHWEDFAFKLKKDGKYSADLNLLDRTAYGIKKQKYRKETDSYVINLTALPQADVELVRPGARFSRPVCYVSINGKRSVVFHIYAQAVEGAWLPVPVYVNAHGWDPHTGEEQIEEVLKKK
ncbi:unnamed protein product [Amoebophrya sp. A120]|nr:unnamed protein product [Amoebophrya sp. A120]|eukprot:GSA120T00003338001.1